MAEAFRNVRLDEHFVAWMHAVAGRNLKKAKAKLSDGRLKLLLEYLKEWTRVLEPRQSSAPSDAAGDGVLAQMTLVHNVARPVRPAPANAAAVVLQPGPGTGAA
jgi:hypothetical protein